ncbi:hypothetical protein SCE1572_31795 [Sorangium cellulosum So0157-2]|uniref:Uncharacterized protein n=1 Tax=Sorangium cellulosum So0157-2 TaxID=1254432 RepID=S4XZK9_SORCE|nr:hypothetical protein SCE1572_31795 [Sorangium cellulosum So0157-2]
MRSPVFAGDRARRSPLRRRDWRRAGWRPACRAVDRTIDPIDRTITSAGSGLQRRGRRARIPASATRAGLSRWHVAARWRADC